MKRKLIAVAAIAMLAAGLAGCSQQYAPNGTGFNVMELELPGGGTVVCVGSSGGGVDCDWDSVKR